MTGRAPVIALWLVAVLGVVLGGTAVLMWQGASQADVVTREELSAAVDDVESTLAARIAALTAESAGSTPVVNAAKLGGLTHDQFIRSDVAVTGHFNCQGYGMVPWSSETEFTQTQAGREVTSGDGIFDCLVFLPDGATITALRALVQDNSPTGQVECYMITVPINGEVAGTNPAQTNRSGVAATPGIIVLEDTTIEPARVDNTNFSYLAECGLTGGGKLVLKSVSIEYTISGRPTP
jgi:hypothetical protein